MSELRAFVSKFEHVLTIAPGVTIDTTYTSMITITELAMTAGTWGVMASWSTGDGRIINKGTIKKNKGEIFENTDVGTIEDNSGTVAFNSGAHLLHMYGTHGGIGDQPVGSVRHAAAHYGLHVKQVIKAYRAAAPRATLIFRTTNSVCEGNWVGERAEVMRALTCAAEARGYHEALDVCCAADRRSPCTPERCYRTLLINENVAAQREEALRLIR